MSVRLQSFLHVQSVFQELKQLSSSLFLSCWSRTVMESMTECAILYADHVRFHPCHPYIECTDALILYARFCDRKVYHHRPVPTTLSRHSHDQIVAKEHLTPSLNAPCSNIIVDGH